MPHFSTCAGPSGSGKTYAATTFAGERVPRNVKSAFIQPTIALCKQSYTDARDRFPDIQGVATQPLAGVLKFESLARPLPPGRPRCYMEGRRRGTRESKNEPQGTAR